MSFTNDLILLFTLLAGINLPAQNPFMQHYTTEDGLPSNTVYYVMQDSRHFIWFATDAGVARYDGSHFDYFTKKNGLSSNEVVRIQEDSFGRIWFFNLNGTINFHRYNTIFNEQNAPYLDSLSSEEFFRRFFEDTDKTLYFYYNDHGDIVALDTLNDTRKYRIPSIFFHDPNSGDSLEWMVIRYMSKSDSGDFILWTQAGQYKLKNLSDNPTPISQGLSIKDVFPAKNQTNYLIGRNMLNGGHLLLKYIKDEVVDSIDSPLKPTYYKLVSSILEDNKDFLWISTFDEGIVCLQRGEVIKRLDIKEGQAMMQDSEKNIWITSMKDGVYKISPYEHFVFQSGQRLSGPVGISALAQGPGDGIWCTNGFSIGLLLGTSLYPVDLSHSTISFNRLKYLNNKTLLAWQKGTACFAFTGIDINPARKKIFYKRMLKSVSYIKEIDQSRSGDELATFSSLSVYVFTPDHFIEYSGWNWLKERIYNVFYNRNNDVIVNSAKNRIYRNGLLEVCNELSAFNNKIITNHLILNDSTELINIEGDSLYIYTSRKICNLTDAFTPPLDVKINHMVYEKKRLYLASTQNIYLCEDPGQIFLGRRFHLSSLDITFRNIRDLLVQHGVLYIASDDGLVIIPDSLFQEKPAYLPIPYIRSVLVNDLESDPDQDRLIWKGKNRISFTFGSKSYSSSPVTFEYMLEGLDTVWNTGGGTHVVYQNLSPGRYLFRVRARKPASPWSDPVEYPVLIKTTLWQHPLFFAGVSLLFAILVALVIVRRKNLQMKRREIDHQLITLEQKALQSMMNPHFIFNALSSIQSFLLQNKAKEAGLYLSQFARLIRQNLEAINAPMILITEEMERLRNYLDLERFRMSEGFDYTIEMDEGVEEEENRIPSMIIQPFVENAILHGLSASDQQGLIRILISTQDEESVQIVIEDNGIGMRNSGNLSERSEKHLHMGIGMIRKRLEIIGQKMHVKTSFDISEAYPGSPHPGTRVTLLVPVSYGRE